MTQDTEIRKAFESMVNWNTKRTADDSAYYFHDVQMAYVEFRDGWHARAEWERQRQAQGVGEATAALVRHFRSEVSRQYPNATAVPSDEHWRQKAAPIIDAIRPYLRTPQPPPPVSEEVVERVARIIWPYAFADPSLDRMRAKATNVAREAIAALNLPIEAPRLTEGQ